MATGGRSGGTLHTLWLWLLTMAEAVALILGMHVVWGCGKSRVLIVPPCTSSSSRLHLCPLLNGLLAFYLAFLCHLHWFFPLLDFDKGILLSTPHTRTQTRQVSPGAFRIIRVFECGNPHCTPRHPTHSFSDEVSGLGARE